MRIMRAISEIFDVIEGDDATSEPAKGATWSHLIAAAILVAIMALAAYGLATLLGLPS